MRAAMFVMMVLVAVIISCAFAEIFFAAAFLTAIFAHMRRTPR
jgi:hypothetical protein